MIETPDPTRELWGSVLALLGTDDRITPQLQGFINLVEPKGVLAGTLYLEVPNELTRGMLDQFRFSTRSAQSMETTGSRTSRSSSTPTSSTRVLSPTRSPLREKLLPVIKEFVSKPPSQASTR